MGWKQTYGEKPVKTKQKFCLRVSKKTVYWGSDVLQQM
jgi:hypothetical protein